MNHIKKLISFTARSLSLFHSQCGHRDNKSLGTCGEKSFLPWKCFISPWMDNSCVRGASQLQQQPQQSWEPETRGETGTCPVVSNIAWRRDTWHRVCSVTTPPVRTAGTWHSQYAPCRHDGYWGIVHRPHGAIARLGRRKHSRYLHWIPG